MVSKLKAALLLISLYTFALKVHAQEATIKITRKYNDNKSVDLLYEKADPGTYTVVIKFTDLTNSNDIENHPYSVDNFSGRLTTLNPINKDQNINFSFSYFTIRGKLNPKYNASFTYLLPYKKAIKTKAVEVGFLNARYFGSTTPDDWKVYRFYTETEDTVTAIRKGTVVIVNDTFETDGTSEASFTSKVNELTVEHADGTLANYKGFKKGSIAVKVGETVYPGTTLGINSSTNSSNRFNILLSITYLKSADIESTRNLGLKNYKSLYGFVTPHFMTEENADLVLSTQKEYIAANSPEIIKKEFSKKELKQSLKKVAN